MARPRKGEEIGASSTIGLRVARDLRGDLETVAEANGLTITEQARLLLEKGIAAEKRRLKIA